MRLHELKIRKLLEKQREALRQQQAGQQVPNVLLQRIRRHPFVVQHGRSDLESIQNQAVQELQRHAQHEQQTRLQEWRSKMRSSLKRAGQWVKMTNTLPVTSVCDAAFKEGEPASTNQECLEAIQRGIWDRDKPDPDAAFQF